MEKMSKNLGSRRTRSSNRRLKVFIWLDKSTTAKKTGETRNLYKYAIKTSGEKRQMKNKTMYMYSIPEHVLHPGGIIDYSGTLNRIIQNYFNYFDSSIKFVKDGFTLLECESYMFTQVQNLLKMLENENSN
jgi:hypothetical protein